MLCRFCVHVGALTSRLGQIDKIDPLYYKYSKRINIAEETKMSATQQESEEYYKDAVGTFSPLDPLR